MEPLLEAHALSKSYRCGRTVLRDASFTLNAGEITAVTGKSGGGKSTLARMLCGTVRASGGAADFAGMQLITPLGYNKAVRPAIQLVPQQPYASLDPRQSVLEAVSEPLLAHRLAAGKKEAQERAAWLLQCVRLGPELFARRPDALSGGQAQRVAIARALSVRPSLLIADEATAMLDQSSQAQVLRILCELVEKEKLAVLLISHDKALVEAIAQRHYHLEDGGLTML